MVQTGQPFGDLAVPFGIPVTIIGLVATHVEKGAAREETHAQAPAGRFNLLIGQIRVKGFRVPPESLQMLPAFRGQLTGLWDGHYDKVGAGFRANKFACLDQIFAGAISSRG